MCPLPSVDRAGDSGAVAAAATNTDAAAVPSSIQAADTAVVASSELQCASLLEACPLAGLGCALVWLGGAAAAAASSPVKHMKCVD